MAELNRAGIPTGRAHREAREIFFEWLRSYRLDLVPRYEQLFEHGAYVGKEERERIHGLLRQGHAGGGARAMRRSVPERDPVMVPETAPAHEPAQARLF